MLKANVVNLREYSISKFKLPVRDALNVYKMRVTQILSEEERRKVEKGVARYPLASQEDARKYLTYVAETVFLIEVLGLDKGEAIDRLRSWVGDRLHKDWRLDAS